MKVPFKLKKNQKCGERIIDDTTIPKTQLKGLERQNYILHRKKKKGYKKIKLTSDVFLTSEYLLLLKKNDTFFTTLALYFKTLS